MSSPTVLLLHQFPPENAGGLDALEAAIRDRCPDVRIERATDRRDAIERIADVEIVIEHAIDDELLAAAEELEWLQSLSSGYDGFDLDALADRGVALTTVSGVHATPIAHQVLGYILTFERGLARAQRQKRNREWRRFAPGEPTGKTVGIVGVGAIGGRIAEFCDSIGMDVIGVKRDLSDVPEAVEEIYSPSELHTVLGRSEYVVAACPLTDATRGLFDERAFSSMDREAVFINIARGEVADQDALIEALRTGYLGGAALDVAAEEPLPRDSPLWEMENVVVTPHASASTREYVDRVAALVRENARRLRAGEDLANRVV